MRGSRTPDFQAAAKAYADRGITVVRLVLDDDGQPKRPANDFYPNFRIGDNLEQDWKTAEGIGIVLGRPSGGWACIDVDDTGLGEYLERNLAAEPNPPLMARTPRPGHHIYVVEPEPSRPLDLEVRYQGRSCLVQLLALGCQAAAPPTPDYSWTASKAEPLYGDLESVWGRIAVRFGLFYRPATPWSFLRHERSRGFTTAQLRSLGG